MAVVMPVRNEAAHLVDAVEAVLAQDYPGTIIVCLAVGPSDDDTADVADTLSHEYDHVTVVDNPSGRTPAGLNAAIRASTEPIIVRVDGHSELAAGYVRRAVETLERTGAVNVGGIQLAVGRTPFERAAATAMMSRLGTGGSRFRVGGDPGPVDTVYLGVFRRDALESAGAFDESLIRNQDYELNIRLRDAGGVVWFDPELSVTYRPRATLRGLARQYFEYGQWKREVVRRHPASMQPRQAIPPVACLGVIAGLVASIRFRPAAVAPLTYAAAVGVSAIARHGLSFRERCLLAVIYPTIHFAWTAGLLAGPR